jgi:hypothetical protein
VTLFTCTEPRHSITTTMCLYLFYVISHLSHALSRQTLEKQLRPK